jgi:hypothetical protein
MFVYIYIQVWTRPPHHWAAVADFAGWHARAIIDFRDTDPPPQHLLKQVQQRMQQLQQSCNRAATELDFRDTDPPPQHLLKQVQQSMQQLQQNCNRARFHIALYKRMHVRDMKSSSVAALLQLLHALLQLLVSRTMNICTTYT